MLLSFICRIADLRSRTKVMRKDTTLKCFVPRGQGWKISTKALKRGTHSHSAIMARAGTPKEKLSIIISIIKLTTVKASRTRGTRYNEALLVVMAGKRRPLESGDTFTKCSAVVVRTGNAKVKTLNRARTDSQCALVACERGHKQKL